MGEPDALSWQADHGTGAGNNDNIVLLKPVLFAICALEGMVIQGDEANILKEICQENRQGMQEDAVAQAARTLQANKGKGVKSVCTDEWCNEGGLLTFRGRIYVPNIPELRRRIVEQHHDSRIAGHPGRWKTLELISRNYWWPQMSRYVGSYTSTCDLCLQTKPRCQLPMGQLHPLPVPAERWSVASVDFIVELPDTHGYDAIMVVVDLYDKRAHLLPAPLWVPPPSSGRTSGSYMAYPRPTSQIGGRSLWRSSLESCTAS